MSLVHTVHPCEAIVNRLANIRHRVAETIRDSMCGLGIGIALSLLAGAPMPLPQISLAGPVVATLAAGKLGGRAAAALGFVSYIILNRPAAGPATTAAALALLVGWAAPYLLERLGVGEPLQEGVSAVVVDCDGFASMDEIYGAGTSAYAFGLLRRALEMETRDSDLIIHAQGNELILVLEGSRPAIAQTIMARVESRFSGWLSDAGYDCNLSVGLLEPGFGACDVDDAPRAAHWPHRGPYLD